MTRLTLWSPLHELSDIQHQLTQLFDENIGGRIPGFNQLPPVNISETEKEIIVEAALPGLKSEDVDIQVSKDSVTIQGETKLEEKEEKKNFFRQEIRTTKISRTLPLPYDVDPDKAEAEFTDGMLKLTLPKAPETIKKKIKVKASK